jgi:AraC-like ligand binding domain
MKVNQSDIRVWRSQYLPSIELVHNVSQAASLPRHFHEELELVIRQGDGWQFNYRGTMYSVPSDTLVVTQPGEVHHANWKSERDCTFRGLRIDLDLLQQVALEIAGHKTDVPFFPMPLVYDRDLTHQIVSPNIWNATARLSNSIANFTGKTTTQTGAIDRESSHCHWICESKPLWIALQAARFRYADAIRSRQQESDKFQCLDLLGYRHVRS